MKHSTDQRKKVMTYFEETVLPELYNGARNCDDLLNLMEEAVGRFNNERQLGRQLQGLLEDIQDRMIIAKYQCINNDKPVPQCLIEHQQFVDTLAFNLKQRLEIAFAS